MSNSDEMSPMPIITLAGVMCILFGCILIAFTPKERIIRETLVTQPWPEGVAIPVLGDDGTVTSVPIAMGKPGQILTYDASRSVYRWIDAPQVDKAP